MSTIPSPTDAQMPLTDALVASTVYRGMARAITEMSPPEPVFGAVDQWLEVGAALQAGRFSYDHVLADVLSPTTRIRRGVSLTLSRDRADFYATSSMTDPYSREGFVGTFALAPRVHAMLGGGRAPFLIVCADGTVFLDPRHARGTTEFAQNMGFRSIELMQASARVDDELILVHGTLRAASVAPVSPKNVGRDFFSWQFRLRSTPGLEEYLSATPVDTSVETDLKVVSVLT